MTGTAESEVARWKLGTGYWELHTRGEAAEHAELRAEQIRHILNERGVPLIQFVVYRNFGLHVDKLCRDYSGETLRLRVLDAVLRWKCYGCRPEVLNEICKQVFALEVD